MNQVKTLACIVWLMSFGWAFGSTNWPNEPAGSQVALDCPFNDRTCGGALWDVYNSGTPSASLPDAPFSPPNAFHDVLVYPNTTGGSQMDFTVGGRQTPQQNQEMYAGFWWRTNPEFSGNMVGANKLFFIKGGNTNGVFMWSLPQTGEKVGQIFWAPQQFENEDQCADGGLTCRPNVNSVPVRPGVWYRIEAYIRASSCDACHDGIVRWWVNGVLVGNYTRYAYGGPVNVWEWTETWDGETGRNGKGFTADAHHYIDHLRVTVPNCGASGCAIAPYVVITSSLSTARRGVPFTATLTASGGTQPYTWFLESGKLPAGLSLNKGVISGTPTCAGRSDFTLRVTDAGQPSVTTTKPFTIITSGTGCASGIDVDSEARTEGAQFTAKAFAGSVAFQLPSTGNSQYRLSVYDLAGKKVYEHASMAQREVSIIKNFKNGVYLAKLAQGKQTSTIKFNVMN